jgi:putative intracellular protease/amidase
MTRQQFINETKHISAQYSPEAVTLTKPPSIPFRRLRSSLFYLLAFALLPLLVGGVTGAINTRQIRVSEPPAFNAPLPPLPVHDPTKLTAVVLAGNRGTENADFLAPYSVLATSGAFNIYVVAPERRLSPVTPMPPLSPGVDIIPHFSFAKFDQAFKTTPDLIVIPNYPHLESPEDWPIVQWIRDHAGVQTVVLSICGGAEVLAETGLLDGRQATTHHNIINRSEQTYPAVRWVRGLRYVEDGNFVSSAGITSGVDATLYVVKRMVGADTARVVARQLNYPHVRFLDAPAYGVPGANFTLAFLNIAYGWGKERMGVYLYEGVDEMALTSIFDTYPFSAITEALTVAPEREIIRSKHGLYLVPRYDFQTAPAFDRLLAPGSDLPAGKDPALEQWAQAEQGVAVEYLHQDHADQYVFDVTLTDMAPRQSQAIVKVAVNGLAYPIETLPLEGSSLPLNTLVRPLALVGLGLALWLKRRRVALR